MRCLTLADGLKQHGAQIRFISRRLPQHLCSILVDKGHEIALLDNDQNPTQLDELAHSHWLGVSQSQDAVDAIKALSDREWDWLVVDHYGLDKRWENALRNSVKQIMVIDDIADRHHDCDILLDQNYYADMETRYIGKVPTHSQLLLGPHYALLRDEYRRLHNQIIPRDGPVKRVLVFFGGVDADNYTECAIEALSELGMQGLHVDVVIGVQHRCLEQIKVACARQGFICYVQTDKMAELMAAADLSIGAGGLATWERCCLGLPTLSICLADNQRKQIDAAADEGYLYAPTAYVEPGMVIQNHTRALIENDHIRKMISSRAMQAVDGRGVLRIVGRLGCSGIEMRFANKDDSKKLFEWRNNPKIREVSRNAEFIRWEDHQKWFAAVLNSEDKVLLIGQIDEAPVGVVRFDKQGEHAEVSIYLVPEKDYRGYGRNLLLSAEQWIKDRRSDIKYIRASVLGGNIHSQNLFLDVAYKVEASHYIKQLQI